MSLPVCARCQKIYTDAIVPEKCLNCGGEVKGLVIKANDAVLTTQNNGDSSFGAVIAGIIFLAIVVFLGWQLLSWLFSLDWSNDGEPTRFRIPFRRR